ncbi:hypothetical protein CVD28_03035 [Bacillus sp. M6-12]|uniref:hypothetical protein n=1 Tax=Bacillus sp. M6-12 TaxID=2054166 RepID=UPI000C78718A|nr:hypothetical protein [Bacillus sp. M6-12]PLS19404.1 hypothetical protein CVD28_03035 [Bacillus sp. M6-12]
MNNELTIPQLEEYLQPLIHFGKLELKLSDTEDGKKIEVFERDEYTYEAENGKIENGGDLTRPLALYTNEKGVIGFIEHTYGAFTTANKEEVIHVANLIGKVIKFDESIKLL